MTANTIYLFDVDGTLTPSRQKIDPEFKSYFLNWIKSRQVYLLSGSDYKKTVEQVGSEVTEAVGGSYNTCGNVGYVKGVQTYRNEWEPPEKLFQFLNQLLIDSPYPVRTSDHIEIRIGMVNFSIVGRGCTYEQRLEYNRYDSKIGERASIVNQIIENFPELEASIGGQISVDLYPKGKNKGQVVGFFQEPIHFIGDRTEPGGNDYDIAKLLQHPPNKVSQVNTWRETYALLKEISLQN